jgi:hypothetical protein
MWHGDRAALAGRVVSCELRLAAGGWQLNFYGYTVRATTNADLALAVEWTPRALDARFWLKQDEGRQSFLAFEVKEGLDTVPGYEAWTLAFFQVEHVKRDQVRLHFQASPFASRKKILRGITLLVPLIEKGLASGGVKHIFFTSHSLAMIAFMEKRMGYRLAQNTDGGVDGAVMFKEISGQLPVASGQPNRPIHGQTAERGAK